MKKDIIYSHFCEGSSLIIQKKEILRYMNCQDGSRDIDALIDSCLLDVTKAISPKASFGLFDIDVTDNKVTIDNTDIVSDNLSKNLKKCRNAIIISLTLGAGFDYLLHKHSRLSPSKALCINAIGNSAIEAYADSICNELTCQMAKAGLYTRPRFSPGYGDFGLEYQAYILNLTNSQRLNGISLTDSLIMIPSKSITAIIGVSTEYDGCHKHGCEACSKENCEYKR